MIKWLEIHKRIGLWVMFYIRMDNFSMYASFSYFHTPKELDRD